MTQPTRLQQITRVLHLEDDEKDHFLVKEKLAAEGLQCKFEVARSRAEFETAVRRSDFDIIISDYSIPAYDGLKALSLVRESGSESPFILFSGTVGEDIAIESLKAGATDYVLKQRPQRLVSAVRRALREAEERALRRQAEERIREQAALLDKARDAIIVLDMQEQIVFWSRGAERTYGWSAKEALGQNADRLLATQEIDLLAEAKKHVLERGEWMGQCFQATKDGRKIMVGSRWTLLRDAAGNPKARLIINSDITEFKKLEAQLLRAQRLETIGALAGGIAHDLNNILSPILMSTDLLAYDLTDPESRKMLNTMRTCARRGAEMVKQILSFARGVAGQSSIILIKPLVTEMASLAKDTFPRSIRIETAFAPDLPLIVGNSTHLHQVLMNLCVNARDAMPEGGVLRLEVSKETVGESSREDKSEPAARGYIGPTVADTGHGMTPEVLEKMYDPFFTTKTNGKGTGLGLATVKDIVKNHHGFLNVSSEVGKGTTFKVYLPASPLSEKQGAESASAPPPMGNGETILVVDDELAISEMVRGTLQSFNYRVLTAQNGDEAVHLYQQQRSEISAVVMDMMMPIMDGPAAIKAIQQLSADVGIIGTSGLESHDTLERARILRMNAFLRKPFTMDNLLVTLHRVLTKKT